MDYKNTLNLPRTDFPMKADLVAREPERLARWQAADLYRKIQHARADAPKFVLHDGPPFANGDVHIGTALNKILKDIIVKYKALRGFRAPYVPGWDCHGLPIEFKVTQEMREAQKAAVKSPEPGAGSQESEVGSLKSEPASSGDNFAPAEIRRACDAYARKYIDVQRTQFKRLGVLGDWENPYLTLDKQYEADELRLFANIVEKGFVYRGKKPVYWSIPCRTALAEAEVEYKDHVSQSIFVKFPFINQPNTFVLIWTTTPWTLPANLGVAYNSTFQYVEVRVGEERFVLFGGLVAGVAEKCGWKDYTQRPVSAAELSKIEYRHPFCNRTGRLYAGDTFVTSDTGTGFVHVAPGHGLEDYGLGLQHGWPVYSPVDDDGRFTYTSDLPREAQMPSELIGKSILEKHGKSDANEAVLHELRTRNALLHQENYHHSYPHCWRSKSPIIFRAMDQWFIRIDHSTPEFEKLLGEQKDQGKLYSDFEDIKTGVSLATLRCRALKAIDNEVDWIPDWGKNRIEAAVKSRPDWCISRQRSWGVPIPAFYDADSKEILDARIIRNAADLIREHGSNVWFEKSASDLWSLLKPAEWTGAEALTKSNDTLDVWIDSGSSSQAVLMRHSDLLDAARNPQHAWQADLYLEGSDQHRGWFQSSLLLSLAGNNDAPYKTVLTHGFMVDADREKISKSKQGQGVYEKPQTSEAYVKKYGADVVRLWVASQDFRSDIVVSDERIAKVGETYRGIRNALRYQLSNLYDFNPAQHAVPDDKLTGLDRWILTEFSRLEQEVMGTWKTLEESRDPLKQGAYDKYEFHVVYQKVSQFVAVELSAIYHDVIKDRLYTDPANSIRRRSTQTTLHRIVTSLCTMLAPILSFTADEAWEFVASPAVGSIHLSQWRPLSFVSPDAEKEDWKVLFEARVSVLPELEKARQTKSIGKSLEAKVELLGTTEAELNVQKNHIEELRELLNVSQLEVRLMPRAEGTSAWIPVVKQADGQKCERCWHWETDVGNHAQHPTLCGRCVKAVQEVSAEN